jgi:hypothetical protein
LTAAEALAELRRLAVAEFRGRRDGDVLRSMLWCMVSVREAGECNPLNELRIERFQREERRRRRAGLHLA